MLSQTSKDLSSTGTTCSEEGGLAPALSYASRSPRQKKRRQWRPFRPKHLEQKLFHGRRSISRNRFVFQVGRDRRAGCGAAVVFGLSLGAVVNVGQPRARRLALARSYLEEPFLNPLGDAAAPACSHRDTIDGSNRGNLGGGAAKEKLVGHV